MLDMAPLTPPESLCAPPSWLTPRATPPALALDSWEPQEFFTLFFYYYLISFPRDLWDLWKQCLWECVCCRERALMEKELKEEDRPAESREERGCGDLTIDLTSRKPLWQSPFQALTLFSRFYELLIEFLGDSCWWLIAQADAGPERGKTEKGLILGSASPLPAPAFCY